MGKYRLVAAEHSDLVEKDERTLNNKIDIIDNIACCSNDTRNQRIRHVSSFGCGVISVLFGVVLVFMSLRMLWETPSEESVFDYIPATLFLIEIGTICILGFGYAGFADSLTIHTQRQYAEIIFQEFIDRGQVIEGRVVSTKITNEGKQAITYQFLPPNEDTVTRGVFVTSTKESFPDRCKVAVFYLNRYMHILL